MLGQQFQDRLFAADWRGLAAAQAPLFWEQVFAGDLTWAGLAFAAIGAVWLLWRRPGDALLLASGAAGVTAFAVGYAVPDAPVFVIPALLCLWLFAAAGCEQALRAIAATPAGAGGRRGGRGCSASRRWRSRSGSGGSTAGRVDRSGDRQDALQVERLFEVLPPQSAIVSGDFIADRMLQYQKRGRGLPRASEIQIGPRDAAALRALLASEVQVVAFAPAVDRLRYEGLDFSATPVALLDGPVADLVARLPRGAVVALAVPGEHAPRFAANFLTGAAPPGRGRPVGRPRLRARRRGRGLDAGPFRLSPDAGGARLTLPAGDGVWGHGRSELELVAETGTAAIRLGGRDLVRTAAGVALAVWAPDGQLLRAAALQAADGYLVPVPAGPFSAYPLIGTADGAGARRRTRGSTSRRRWAAAASSCASRPAAGSSSTRATTPGSRRRCWSTSGRGPVDMTAFETPPGVEPDPAGPPRPAAASVALPDRVCYTSRVAAAASEGAPVSMFLAFGGVPRRAAARIVSSGADAGIAAGRGHRRAPARPGSPFRGDPHDARRSGRGSSATAGRRSRPMTPARIAGRPNRRPG